ncbi:ROK family transcriptional regulator [Bowdeniella nasicola]|uniref:ROK family transcriptional regulator n=1 Tax=Bowdeniella nasicola TaxID=208480 RepID=UPI0009F81A52|nr:ROK family transcriptional regulator [Bowdeniella nasicola]
MNRTGEGSPTRKLHESRVLELLRTSGAMTRGELADATGITRSTISEIVTDMLDRGAVVVAGTDRDRPGRGRRAEHILLDPSAGQYLGIDIRHDRADIVVTNASYSIIASDQCHYPTGTPWADRIEFITAAINYLAVTHHITIDVLQAVGVGIPGPFLASDPTQHEGIGPLVNETLSRQLHAPVVVENNVRLAALAEASWDRPSPVPSLMYVRFGAGVGGGIVIDGTVLNGFHGSGSEIGHINVGVPTLRCRCGDTGCLEMVAANPALLRTANEAGADVTTIADLAELADEEPVRSILERMCDAIAQVLTAAIRVIDPSDIVIAGEIFTRRPELIEAIEDRISASALTRRAGALTCQLARLGTDAGALGGICAVADLPHLPFSSRGTRAGAYLVTA